MTRAWMLLVCAASILQGERRALLVGIDRYMTAHGPTTAAAGQHPSIQPPAVQEMIRARAVEGTPSRKSIDPLDGAVNDALAMKEILVQHFGYAERNTVLLTNEQATAIRILSSIQNWLIDEAKPGDASLFYFAGHGSRIRNVANKSNDFDSTIVPVDSLLGVPDIRGKELARLYDQAAKKGITLTVIVDSCYSAGASRGALVSRKTRDTPIDMNVSVNETLDVPLPEDSGVLVISASQDYEPAAELADTDLNGPHGVFTWAFLHALASTSPDESIDRIFQRSRALMQSKAPGQEPVLLAKKGRNTRGLFGQPANSTRSVMAAVSRVNGPVIKLDAGLAAGLHEGCELKRTGKPDLEIRITKINGLSSSDAIISRQADKDARAQPGDLFELLRWVVPDRELLRVYIPDPAPKAELKQALEVAQDLRQTLVSDPTSDLPTHILTWDPVARKWCLRENRAGAASSPIRPLTVSGVTALLPKSARLFVEFPPDENTTHALMFDKGAVAIVRSPELADYVLLGRLRSESPTIEYAWALADFVESDLHGTLPLRPLLTNWFAEDIVQSLKMSAVGLAKITGWLNLAPPAGGEAPYGLVLQNTKTGQIVSSGEVHDGETYKLMLRRRPDVSASAIPSRRAYVFIIDSYGKGQLLFGDNLQNEFPRPGQTTMPELTPLSNFDEDFTIGGTPGVDNYYLLTSATPIGNPETVFNFEGVRTRGADISDPLSRLIGNRASGTRGSVTGVPLNWSIERLTILSVPKGTK